jgi:hypothetical protein
MGAMKLKQIVAGSLATAILMLTAACSKSGGSVASSGGGGPVHGFSGGQFGAQGCGNCGTANAYMVTALGQHFDRLQIGMDVYFDPRYIYSAGSLMDVFQSYRGPIAASGEMEIYYDDVCGAQPGVYRMRTVQAGEFVGGSQFRGLVLEGQNMQTGLPIVVAFTASNNYLSYLSIPSYSFNGIPYNYKVMKTMRIISVGNMQCPNGIYEMY